MSCGLLLQSGNSFGAQQSSQTEVNKKIVVIFKGSNKKSAAAVSLDGREKGELLNETYIAIPAKRGSHEVAVGKHVIHSIPCYIESMSAGGSCTAGGAQDQITFAFSPATLKVNLSGSDAAYILVEPYKPEGCCSQINQMKLVDYKLREIKAKDAEKLLSKCKAIP